jgi:hypothetical protein
MTSSYGLLRDLLRPSTLKAIAGLIFTIFMVILMYNVIVPPEHCVESSQEIKTILLSKGVGISHSDIGQNKICFRSNDQNLIKEINEKSQNTYLELELAKIKGNQAWWDRNGLFVIIIIAVCITGIIIAFILSRRDAW